MSGEKQHYIPSFFQRGFGVPRSGKPDQIWKFEKGMTPSEPSIIKRTAVGVHFYSPLPSDGTVSLDEKLTKLETPLSRDVAKARAAGVGKPVNPEVAARVVTHLAPRTSYMRAALERGLKGVLTGAGA